MGLFFIIGLLVWAWAEISTFMFISSEIGGVLTILGVALTAIIGITLLKKQGLSVVNRVRSDLTEGYAPVVSIADSISLVIGGGLMFIPGYLTDAVGFLLFIPGIRTIAGMYFLQWIAKKPRFTGFVNFSADTFTQRNGKRYPFGFTEQPSHQDDLNDVIEGEFEERSETKTYIKQKKKNDRSGA